MVERIEEYGDVLKVILKPTKKFPYGYFYTDNNQIARQLIESYNWYLHRHNKNTYVETRTYGQVRLLFHQEYAKKILGYYPSYLDHINGVEIDNRDYNLNAVTSQQNNRNKHTIGYCYVQSKIFVPKYVLNYKTIFRGSYKSEPEALLATYHLRQQVYADYDYNFFLDRRDDEDILDAELTRKITTQQAIYLHVKRYAGTNPWYVYRYNLFAYCQANQITIPSFELDNQGFMINPVTKQRLCPY